VRSDGAPALSLLVVAVLAAGCAGSAPPGHPAPGSQVLARGPEAAPSAAVAFQQGVVQVVQEVAPSVVLIDTRNGFGSGVIFDSQGDIVTNAHVVEGGGAIEVTLASGRRYGARLVGSFVADDLAVIRVRAGTLRPATFGDSSELQVGELVVAIGNPLGVQSSVTEGIVSALGRTVEEPGAVLPDMIQTSAPVNPGNSGGALADLWGEVVGMPTAGATDPDLGSAPGIGFAIASNVVRDIATQIVRYGRVVSSHRADLGITAATAQGQGALVMSVSPGGPAERAGIGPDQVITSVDGQPTPSAEALAEVLAGLRPGQAVPVTVQGDGPSRSVATVTVTLGQYPGG
jgi:putative serine protease PepD